MVRRVLWGVVAAVVAAPVYYLILREATVSPGEHRGLVVMFSLLLGGGVAGLVGCRRAANVEE